jgi:hypothetical protein
MGSTDTSGDNHYFVPPAEAITEQSRYNSKRSARDKMITTP